jgi:putative transposase
MSQSLFVNYCKGMVSGNKCRARQLLRNAQAESFFSWFKAELMRYGVFEKFEQAWSEIFCYIEAYDNLRRLYSSLGYKSPLEFERELQTENGVIKKQFFI